MLHICVSNHVIVHIGKSDYVKVHTCVSGHVLVHTGVWALMFLVMS